MRYTIRFSVLILFALLGLIFISTARAAGVTKHEGDTGVWTCVPPTTYQDGALIFSGTEITYKVYISKVVNSKGTLYATGTNCSNISAPMTGLEFTQYHSAITASIVGRGESVISASDGPFVFAADPASLPNAPTAVTFQ